LRLSERASTRGADGCGSSAAAASAGWGLGLASGTRTTAAISMVVSALSLVSTSSGVDAPDEAVERCADSRVDGSADGEAVEASAAWLETASDESLAVASVCGRRRRVSARVKGMEKEKERERRTHDEVVGARPPRDRRTVREQVEAPPRALVERSLSNRCCARR